jgi:hypothetical protein
MSGCYKSHRPIDGWRCFSEEIKASLADIASDSNRVITTILRVWRKKRTAQTPHQTPIPKKISGPASFSPRKTQVPVFVSLCEREPHLFSRIGAKEIQFLLFPPSPTSRLHHAATQIRAYVGRPFRIYPAEILAPPHRVHSAAKVRNSTKLLIAADSLPSSS